MKNPDEIIYCCDDCGRRAAGQANIALPANQVSTWRQGKCGACGKTASVTHVRAFNFPFHRRAAQVAHWT